MSHLPVWFVTFVIQCGATPNFGHCTTTVKVWERIGEYTLSTTLHISREKGCVNPIVSTIIAKDTLNFRTSKMEFEHFLADGACQADI